MTDLQSLGAAMGADIGADIGAVYDQLAPSIREAVKRGRPFHPAAPLIRNPEAYNRAIQNLHHHAHSPAVAHHPVLAKALQHHAILASTIARLEAQRKYEAKIKPTTVVGCNFDGVGAASLSPVATIGTPYQGQDYAITGFLVWGGGSHQFRLTQFNPGGVDLATGPTTQAVKGTNATNPGIPLSIWAAEFLAKTHPRYTWAPWTGRAMVFSSEATFNLQVYNAGATSANCSIAIFMQCTPCGANNKFKMMKLMKEAHLHQWYGHHFAAH